MSTDGNVGIAESWDDDGADPVKVMEERFQKVKIMQREQDVKKAAIKKWEENAEKNPTESAGPSQNDEPKRLLLRRPKNGENSSKTNDSSMSQHNQQNRGRKGAPGQNSAPPKTLEERQAEYQAARQRIMGSEYKPDVNETSEIGIVERSKSPETVPIPRIPSNQRIVEFQNINRQHIPDLLRQTLPPPPPPGHIFHQQSQMQQQHFSPNNPYANPYSQHSNAHIFMNNNSQLFHTPTHIPPPSMRNPIPFGCPPGNVSQYMNHGIYSHPPPSSYCSPPPPPQSSAIIAPSQNPTSSPSQQ
ncbi:unnamed protein product [Caenorhabditis angaria]|uniref:SUZ domain-containing protein n=1 Tax=Caenorhabditis angaria TaxID=860376 RepID=A0A9P1ICJ9_9PELO|nr:unnamed protein product [Caenorhabditis angaria]